MSDQTFERVALTNGAKATHYTDGATGAGGHVVTLCGRDVKAEAAQRNVADDDARKVCRTCAGRMEAHKLTGTDATKPVTGADVDAAKTQLFDDAWKEVVAAQAVAVVARVAVRDRLIVAWVRARSAGITAKDFETRAELIGIAKAYAKSVRTWCESCDMDDSAILANPSAVESAYFGTRYRDHMGRMDTAKARAVKYTGSSVPGVAESITAINAAHREAVAKYRKLEADGTFLKSAWSYFSDRAKACEADADKVLTLIAKAEATPAEAPEATPAEAPAARQVEATPEATPAEATPADTTPAEATVTAADDMGVAALTADVIARIQRLATMAGVDWDAIAEALADAASMADAN